MKSFSQISESNYDVNFVKNYVFDEDHNSIFQFVKNRIDKKDKEFLDLVESTISIDYYPLEANIGDTVFLVVVYNENSDLHVYGFSNTFDAFGKALMLWKDGTTGTEMYYAVKIFKHKITCIHPSGKRGEAHIKSLEFFGKEGHLLFGDYNKDNNTNDLQIVPEYVNNPKIKNLLLSIQGINKYKL